MATGKAYGFFDCNASKKEIESKLPLILGRVEAPSELEVSLKEARELQNDKEIEPELLEFIRKNKIYPIFPSRFKPQMAKAKPIRMSNLRYMIKAAYPNETNEAAADRLGDIMNWIYLAYGNDMPFNAAIVARINGKYLFRE